MTLVPTFLRRALLWVLAVVVLGPPPLFLGFQAWIWFDTVRDGRAYAPLVFDGVVPYDDVLASRRWFPFWGSWMFDCTYAIVALDPAAPAGPPRDRSRPVSRDFDDYWLEFGGPWTPTPGPDWQNGETIWRHPCEGRLGANLFDRLDVALITPGGWWRQDHERIFLYSKPTGLAAVIRYGD